MFSTTFWKVGIFEKLATEKILGNKKNEVSQLWLKVHGDMIGNVSEVIAADIPPYR